MNPNPADRRNQLAALNAASRDAHQHAMAMVEIGVTIPQPDNTTLPAFLHHWIAVLNNPAGHQQIIAGLTGLLARIALDQACQSGRPVGEIIAEWRTLLDEKLTEAWQTVDDFVTGGGAL